MARLRAARVGVASGVLVAMLLAGGVAQAQQGGATTDAWTRSASLEDAGQLVQAREAMLAAFGPEPADYDACMRIAWLTMRLKDGHGAATYYRRARTLSGAAPLAGEMLVSALTLEGYQALDRGDLPAARRAWSEALRLTPTASEARRGLDIVGPSRGAAPEIWIGGLSATDAPSGASVFYAQLPFRVNEGFTVRGVYRHIGAGQSAAALSTDVVAFGNQDEFYGGIGVEHGVAALEATAFGLHNALETVSGMAATVRAGGRYGVTAGASGMHRSEGWNTQVAPQAFAWVTPALAVAAGIRYTSDPAETATSVLLGSTIRVKKATIEVAAHAGHERWAFMMAGPTILSFLGTTTGGGTVTASFALQQSVRFSIQGQVEQLQPPSSTAAGGHYFSLAAGVRWEPARAHGGNR